MKSLASKVKSLRPQVLENWPVLGSRTAVFFELLKFCEDLFFFFFFWRALALVSLASRVSVLGKAVLGLGTFCVLGLEPCVLNSTSGVESISIE